MSQDDCVSSLCNGTTYKRTSDTIKQYENAEIILLTIIMPVILIFGVIGNVAFLYVVTRISWMHTIPNKYLSHLAVADIILLLAAIGEKLARYLLSPYAYDEAILGYFGCVVIPVMKYSGYYASMLFVTLVTLERYYAVCRPLDRFLNNTNKRSSQVIIGAWTTSSVLGCTQIPATCNIITYCILWTIEELQQESNLPESIGYCHPVNMLHWLEDVSIIIQTITFLFAMICNAILYIEIIRTLNRRVGVMDINTADREQRGVTLHRLESNPGQNHREVTRHMRDRIARMLIVNGTIFFLLMAPFQIIMLAKAFTTKDPLVWEKEFGAWMQIFRVLTYLNSMVNPIVFNVTNPRYRKAFQEAFLCSRLKEDNTSVVVLRPSHDQ
ncbi:thyrotropin-releasing hormone receptor-like [Amphiura filiformis]|uniref:thyrotropin-releasing hormone receptor-like n=1 Tax=Amphiura filiformis TaxID=82378 RepID=UPI003B20D737